MKKLFLYTLGVVAFSLIAFAQNPTPPGTDSPFQVLYVSELDRGEAYLTISNSGTSDRAGGVCANIYVFSPAGTMLSCCSCKVPPNGLVSAAVKESPFCRS